MKVFNVPLLFVGVGTASAARNTAKNAVKVMANIFPTILNSQILYNDLNVAIAKTTGCDCEVAACRARVASIRAHWRENPVLLSINSRHAQ